jgi:PAS domain S-box-containing protein
MEPPAMDASDRPAPDAIVLVNRSGTIVLVNAQAERLFGYGQDELIGKQTEILFSERCRSQHSDQHSRFLAVPLRQPLAENLELFGLRKDGSEFLAEIRLSPLETEGGYSFPMPSAISATEGEQKRTFAGSLQLLHVPMMR